MLGLASDDIYFEVLSALKTKDVAKIFKAIGEFYEEGGYLVYFAKGLLENFRHLLILQSAKKGESFIELGESSIAELKKRKDAFSQGELLLALSILQNLQGHLRRNLAPPKLLVETALLKLLHMDGLHSVEDLVSASASGVRRVLPVFVQRRLKKSLNNFVPANSPEKSQNQRPRRNSQSIRANSGETCGRKS